MKNYFLTISLVIVSFTALFAAENYIVQFRAASKYYENAQYSKAIEIYEDILAKGQKNTALYYNLANAYYKNGMLGKAILFYEKAKRLSPQDSAVKNNLVFANKTLNEPEPAFFESILEWLINFISINTAVIIGTVFYLAFITGLIAFMFIKSRLLIFCNIAAGTIFIVFALLFALQYQEQVLTKWAVVVSSGEARNGPGIENSVGFSVPEGRKVVILGEQDDWYAIGLKNEGLKGWIEKTNIEAI